MLATRDLTVLLVEDDELDAMSVQRAFRKAGSDVELKVAHNGLEALDILRGTGGREPLPMPHVILLDVNMPRLDGHGFLDALRGDPKLRNRVVFMLTTSDAGQDRDRAYDRQVAGYFVKGQEATNYDSVRTLVDVYRRGVLFPD